MWARVVPNASASAPRPNLTAPTHWVNVAMAAVVSISSYSGQFHVWIGSNANYILREFATREDAVAFVDDLLDGIA